MIVGSESLTRFSPDAPCKNHLETDSAENPFPTYFHMSAAERRRERARFAARKKTF